MLPKTFVYSFMIILITGCNLYDSNNPSEQKRTLNVMFSQQEDDQRVHLSDYDFPLDQHKVTLSNALEVEVNLKGFEENICMAGFMVSQVKI